jgi:hypothetical protein
VIWTTAGRTCWVTVRIAVSRLSVCAPFAGTAASGAEGNTLAAAAGLAAAEGDAATAGRAAGDEAAAAAGELAAAGALGVGAALGAVVGGALVTAVAGCEVVD